ncbi:flagellar export chaperone FliS [Ferrimicrobium sp.]|uniref:flagellar export chaperone FliS n=1 Tax=Ferrimicrobium sp. TaxID=2926050 RepID=UPI002611BF6D|nr:flagellar export chaperone FliS [Ferrimicrobium sp.]
MAYSGKRSYTVNAVQTATPAMRLVMVVDQLDASLARAISGYEANDLYEIHCGLKNAQAVVALLRDCLQVELWDGASDIRRIYEYSLDRLVRSNLTKERELLAEAEAVLRPLMAAWRQAAVLVSSDG